MIQIANLSRHYQMGPTTVKAVDDISLWSPTTTIWPKRHDG